MAIEALKGLKSTPHNVFFVFTTQEEVGTRGAETSAYGIDPDLGFSIDVTAWGDTPNQKGLDISLGKGPAIKIKDGGMLAHAGVKDWLLRTAESGAIACQREVLVRGTTDASAIQVSPRTPSYRTTRACGRPCRRYRAARGPAASTTSTGSSR